MSCGRKAGGNFGWTPDNRPMGAATALPGAPRAPRRRIRALPDERLVERVRAGDDTAFEAIYDRYHRPLLAFSRHMVGSQEEAEDVLQHTFIAAYRSLRGSDEPMQLKAWLFAIARNRSLSVLRARREHADIEDVNPATEGLADEVQRRADLREILVDLQALPEDQRAALVLSELGAHSHEEIAVILGVRKDKVKALVFQAREQIAGARAARETPCEEIREQLATLRGGALRRTQLKRHLESCAGCRDFRGEVQRQRAAMAAVLPVIPSVGMKASVLSAAFGSAAGGGAVAAAGGAGIVAATSSGTGAGGAVAALGAKTAATKAVIALAVAGSAAGGAAAVHKVAPHDTPRTPPASAQARAHAAPQSAVQRGIVKGGVPASALAAPTPGVAKLLKDDHGKPGTHAGKRQNGAAAHKGKHAGAANGGPASSHGAGAKAVGHGKSANGRALGHGKTTSPAGEARQKAVANGKRAAKPGKRTAKGRTGTTHRRSTTRGSPRERPAPSGQ